MGSSWDVVSEEREEAGRSRVKGQNFGRAGPSVHHSSSSNGNASHNSLQQAGEPVLSPWSFAKTITPTTTTIQFTSLQSLDGK